MGRIFSYDGPLMTFISKVADLMILNVIWLVCCIPIITIGPATTAMYYVVLKIARDEDYKIVKSFFHSFKMNLKQGIIIFLVLTVVGLILAADYFIMLSVLEGTFRKITQIVLIIWAVVYIFTTMYAYPLLAQFDNTVFGTLKNAFMLSIGHFFSSILLLLLHALPLICFFLNVNLFMKTLPVWVFLAPIGIARLSVNKYRKYFDKMIGKTNEETPASGEVAEI